MLTVTAFGVAKQTQRPDEGVPPAEFGTAGSAPAAPPRRPTPTLRAPAVRRRVTTEGGEGGEGGGSLGSGGAENAVPAGAENKFRIATRPRSGVGSSESNESSEGSNAFGVHAGGGAGTPHLGGANSLLARQDSLSKLRAPLTAGTRAGANSPLANSPLRRASSPRVGGAEGSAGNLLQVPTPPREDAARLGSAARRAPVRAMAVPVVARPGE